MEILDSNTPVEAIIAQTRAAEWKDRWDAVNFIGLEEIEQGMDALIERSLIDENPHPRWRSLWAIATIDPTGEAALDDFLIALDDDDATIAGNAAIALAFFDHDAAREPLIALMTHEDEYRRWEAVFSMRNVPGDGVVDVVVAHLDHATEPDIRVRQESALALGGLGDASTVVGPLVQALGSDPSPQVRWRAALSLKRLGDASILEDLREALDSEEDSQVVEQINETIEALESSF